MQHRQCCQVDTQNAVRDSVEGMFKTQVKRGGLGKACLQLVLESSAYANREGAVFISHRSMQTASRFQPVCFMMGVCLLPHKWSCYRGSVDAWGCGYVPLHRARTTHGRERDRQEKWDRRGSGVTFSPVRSRSWGKRNGTHKPLISQSSYPMLCGQYTSFPKGSLILIFDAGAL